jgi:hypothetical protein
VSSKFLVGVGAWLLGAAAATTGSMVAVGQLANSLLGAPTQQLAGAVNSDELNAGGPASATPAASVSGGPSPTPVAGSVTPTVSADAPADDPGTQSSAPTLLTSADGSVLATCQQGGAYLVYWSPAQGFSADQVDRGPAQVASVTFTSQAGGVVMRVSCTSGTPVAHVFSISSEPSGEPSDE